MSFKFGQVNVSSKGFYKRKQFTDLFSLDYDKVVVSDPIQCNNGKDKRYVIGYETSNPFVHQDTKKCLQQWSEAIQ